MTAANDNISAGPQSQDSEGKALLAVPDYERLATIIKTMECHTSRLESVEWQDREEFFDPSVKMIYRAVGDEAAKIVHHVFNELPSNVVTRRLSDVAILATQVSQISALVQFAPDGDFDDRSCLDGLVRNLISDMEELLEADKPEFGEEKGSDPIKAKLDCIAAALESFRDSQEYSLSPLVRTVYESIRNDIKAIWGETENYDYQKILAVLDAALGNPDGQVDTPAIEEVLLDLINAASSSFVAQEHH